MQIHITEDNRALHLGINEHSCCKQGQCSHENTVTEKKRSIVQMLIESKLSPCCQILTIALQFEYRNVF